MLLYIAIAFLIFYILLFLEFRYLKLFQDYELKGFTPEKIPINKVDDTFWAMAVFYSIFWPFTIPVTLLVLPAYLIVKKLNFYGEVKKGDK